MHQRPERSSVQRGMADMETSLSLSMLGGIERGMDTCLPSESKSAKTSEAAESSVYLGVADMQQPLTCTLKFDGKAKVSIPSTTFGCLSRWQQIYVVSLTFLLLCFHIASASFRPEIGTRALGMSGAFIGNADDPTGALWNPAGLASLQNGDFVYDLSQGAFSLGYPIRRFGTLGFSVLDLNGDDRFFVDTPNNPVGTFERGYNQVLLSYAQSIGTGLQIGGNIGYSRAPYTGSRWKSGYDLGVIVEMPLRLTLGARLMDISGVAIPDESGKILKEFDPRFTLGATWESVQLLQLNSALDTALWHFKTGVEVGRHGLSLRLGTAIDLRHLSRLPNWSLGFSVDWQGKYIHYAYLGNPDVEYRHLLAVGFAFRSTVHPPTSPPKYEAGEPLRNLELKRPAIVNQNRNSFATTQIAQHYGVELEFVLAMVKTESNFNPNAISGSGAVGLTQLMPPTAQDLGLKVPTYQNIRKPTADSHIDERFNPYKNLEAGIRYLSRMLEKYEGNYVLALAAYNAGAGNVRKNVPLIRQTEQHVGRALNYYYQYKAEAALKDADLQKLDAVIRNREG